MPVVEKNLNALMIIILCGILLGAYGVQFILHEEPCPLCMLQRIGMIGVATGALLNLRFGIRMSHYALCLLCAFMGGFVALRQISLHVCPGMPTFGVPVLGLSLYTWSFVVFVCVVLMIALLLSLYDPKDSNARVVPSSPLCKLAYFLIVVVTLANIVTTLLQCGLGVCND